jgi:hypothetical protein
LAAGSDLDSRPVAWLSIPRRPYPWIAGAGGVKLTASGSGWAGVGSPEATVHRFTTTHKVGNSIVETDVIVSDPDEWDASPEARGQGWEVIEVKVMVIAVRPVAPSIRDDIRREGPADPGRLAR